jgi:uncharacterized repeat protein (TIGR01451 family)
VPSKVIIRILVTGAALLALCVFAASAFADASDPVPSATHLAQPIQTNPDGSHTVTVAGGTNASTDPGWQWTTHHSDCNTDRAGVGVAIAWNDPTDPGNPVTGNVNGKQVTIGVGTSSDNVVHPTPGPTFVDSSDFTQWRGGCGVFNGTYNTGTWGPFSHTYPASVSGPFTICPLMYDVHGKSSGTAPNGAGEIIAGGAGHNGDNSLQSNGNTPLGNGCFATTFHTPAIKVVKTAAESAVHVGDVIHYTIQVTNTGDDALTVTPSDLGCVSFDNSSFSLAVGASKTLTCTHQATAGDGNSYTNTACASGVDAQNQSVSGCSTVTTPILHPGIKVVKTVDSASAVAGDTLHYTVTVTNTGDTALTVTPQDTGCSGLDATTFSLAVGASKSLTCTHVVAPADGQSYTNQACATGTDSIGGKVSDCSSVKTDIPGGQAVLGARVTPGTANLIAPTGCVAKAFNARIRGSKVSRVVFTLDGKTIKVFSKNLKSGVYAVRIDPAKFRIGVHRLVAKVTFQKGTGTKAKTIRVSFQRCSKKLAQPRFTG